MTCSISDMYSNTFLLVGDVVFDIWSDHKIATATNTNAADYRKTRINMRGCKT